jgi:hypothetical protein
MKLTIRFWMIALLVLLSSQALAHDAPSPYVTINNGLCLQFGPQNSDPAEGRTVVRCVWPGAHYLSPKPPDPPYIVECPEGSCGNQITILKFLSGSKISGHDRAEGMHRCIEDGLKPLAVIQLLAKPAPPYGYRWNIALCVK